ncbi:predicted glucose-6-phosphate 1-dehydrogenase [Pseudozyma hubeiensis SY62]|uniref:Predicted glucose-6-phosphate 1-dehydrogenase n=1 Tax=Pseudozyma hubeiensis (strain SY62) TaxID=1305764 RepID=R9NZ30_PSEHS|nr:predicted glucose-6-phosphate 1-dehydrogenase [Pseudozyma hubeiensis SY62]GAC93922.1 predicted glucose-6-phosphate 1-dehydrogenase [Pseudozyma hubeiensis SY62]
MIGGPEEPSRELFKFAGPSSPNLTVPRNAEAAYSASHTNRVAAHTFDSCGLLMKATGERKKRRELTVKYRFRAPQQKINNEARRRRPKGEQGSLLLRYMTFNIIGRRLPVQEHLLSTHIVFDVTIRKSHKCQNLSCSEDGGLTVDPKNSLHLSRRSKGLTLARNSGSRQTKQFFRTLN